MSVLENNRIEIDDYTPKRVNFDVFISYRRTDGRDYARNIQLGLQQRGSSFNVFFDYQSVRAGKFNLQIIDAIYSSCIFILVITPSVFENCLNENDWIMREVRTALKFNKRIIPCVIDDAEKGIIWKGWPNNLPDDVKCITYEQVFHLKVDSYFKYSIQELMTVCEETINQQNNSINSQNIEPTNIICDNSQKESPIKTYSQETTNHNKEIESNLMTRKYRITLVDSGQATLSMIKTVRDVTGWDLRHSKEFVDGVPSIFPKEFSEDEMLSIKQAVAECGGVVRVDGVSLAGKHEFKENLSEQKYRVTLVDSGQAKLLMIKAVKDVTGWDLRHSKDFVDGVPSEFPTLFTTEEMLAVKQSITDCGGVVRVEGVSLVGKPNYVDLGLSVKWAKCNLGASKPEEYGGYYQWAGTKDVSDKRVKLVLANCPYHTGSYKDIGWTKYNTKSSYGTFDNKTTLEASDDAATVNLGGKWRMPTNAEWRELIDKCTWTWTTLNGVKGYKVRSNKPGYTDNWIFLPAAGSRDNDYLDGVGSYGSYWSSSLYTDSPDLARYVHFNSGVVFRINLNRYAGQSVRPVSE